MQKRDHFDTQGELSVSPGNPHPFDGRWNIAVIGLTDHSVALAEFLAGQTGWDIHLKRGIQSKVKGSSSVGGGNVHGATEFDTLSTHVTEVFGRYKGFVFIMALGIVNRVIAPLVRNKYIDPAVVCIDDVGRFVISALSGHEGGANALAYQVASITGAEPVITTATEANRLYTCGVGCKKGAGKEEILHAVNEACTMAGIWPDTLRCLSSAWIKADEKGIHEAANSLGIPCRFIPRREIDWYYRSHPEAHRYELVHRTIGVYGVSEPCALLSGRNTVLVVHRAVIDGVTVAIAREELFGSPIQSSGKGIGKHIERSTDGSTDSSTEGAIYGSANRSMDLAFEGPAPVYLVLGGTTEAVVTSYELSKDGAEFFISTATEYGFALFKDKFGQRAVLENFTEESLKRFIKARKVSHVIDCTHPYAHVITSVAKSVCAEVGVCYESRVREVGPADEIDYEKIYTVASMEEAVKKVLEIKSVKPLFTTGSKELHIVGPLISTSGMEVIARVLPFDNSIRKCLDAKLKNQNIIAMQGPFSTELNAATYRQYGVDCLVTKRSGREGGYYEKIYAAIECGISVIVVER
ncbi:MAG: precorrin-6A reductase [Nitrospirae bacterium]|nr:precorrin-6A reductase [Nitrospirota bacterium]